jgi:hypothetical protein
MEKIHLTFGNFIAHFIPGFILLLSGFIAFLNIYENIEIISKNTVIIISVVFVLSLASGLILDVCRYLIKSAVMFVWNRKFSKWGKIHIPDISKANEDDRKYFDWIIEHFFRFHQFYGNLSLSLLFSTLMLHTKKTFIVSLSFLGVPLICIMYTLSIIFAVAAGITYWKTIYFLKQRFQILQSGEEV